MKKLMKKIAVVLCTILAINSVVAGSTIPAKADTGEGQPKGMLNFVCQSNAIIGGHIAYKINGATEFSHPSENSEEHVYESLDLNGIDPLNSFTIKFETSHGYQLDTTRGVALWVNGQKRYSEAGDNIAGFLGDNGYTFNLNAILQDDETVSNSNFELEFGFETQNGGGQNGGGDPHGPEPGMLSFLCQDLEEAAQVMFRFGTDESKEFFTVDNRLVSIPEGESSVTIKFILNDPKVYMLDTGRGVSLRVNGDEKYHLSGQSAEGVMEYTFNLAELAGDKAIDQSSFELSYGFQYSDPSMDKRPQNMLWVYSEEYGQAHHFVDPQGDVDCLVLNGDVDIIAIEYDGTTYSKDELLELGSKEDGQRGDVWYEVDPGNMGYAQIPSGALVTVKLLPDYGYQVLRAELNGSEIAPTEEQSVFTFTMPTNPLHLSAVFEECKDEVVSSAGDIKSGAIQLGANEINAGSALLTVGDSIDEAVFNGTMHELAGYEIASCLEIGLQQVFYKGTKEDYWSNNKDTLTNKATVSLSLADEVGTDVKILHEKHDGTIEILDATVENGVVTFETSSFSTYAIVKVGTSKNETTEAPSTSQSQKNKEENIIDNTPISTSHAGSSSILESGMLIKDINATAVGNTLTIDRSYNRQFLTNAEMKALLKKGTVALRMQYKYNGIEYDITIPAGAAIDDSIPFYGPLYLASHFPATKVTSKGNATKATSGKATKGVVTGSYVINSGDSLYKIARKYGTTVSDLKDKNPQIKNISLIHPGQTINI